MKHELTVFKEATMRALGVLPLLWLVTRPCLAQDPLSCKPVRPGVYVEDDEFYFVATPAQGAVGDVVGVDVGMRNNVQGRRLLVFALVGCYDQSKLELVMPEPQYLPDFDWLVPSSEYERYGDGGQGLEREVSSEVSPIVVESDILKIQKEATPLGDADFDQEVSLADAISILGWLFLGGDEPVCPAAADVNEDHEIDITDPIGILNYLFLGSDALAGKKVFCDQ